MTKMAVTSQLIKSLKVAISISSDPLSELLIKMNTDRLSPVVIYKCGRSSNCIKFIWVTSDGKRTPEKNFNKLCIFFIGA